MSAETLLAIATFTAPEQIGTNPQSMLWLLPMVAAIAVVYKATRPPAVKAGVFLRETAILFGSIVVFIVVAASALCALAWLITE